MIEVDPKKCRAWAAEVVRRLRAADFTAYWAGGCVRDELMGRTPKDYDVATDATPDRVREVFGKRRTKFIGAAFGVVQVLGPRAAGAVEVATFRSDATYSDGRRPDAVTFSTPDVDARRRDFTVNGLFYDPEAEQVIDFVEGQVDIARKLIRAIGDPAARFSEDKLRMLRAVRLAVTLDFEIDEQTKDAITRMAPDVTAISAERLAQELQLVLVSAQPGRGVRLLCETRLLGALLPEVAALAGQTTGVDGPSEPEFDFLDYTERLVQRLAPAEFPLAMAALLHAVARMADTSERADLLRAIAQRLRLSNRENETIVWLVGHQRALVDAPQMPWSQLQPLIVDPRFDELLALHAAHAELRGESTEPLEYCRRQAARPTEELNPRPLLTGSDLIDHNVPQGPAYARLLARVRAAQLDGEIHSRSQALKLVDDLLASGIDDSEKTR
mgnify:CR=1 FL=1